MAPYLRRSVAFAAPLAFALSLLTACSLFYDVDLPPEAADEDVRLLDGGTDASDAAFPDGSIDPGDARDAEANPDATADADASSDAAQDVQSDAEDVEADPDARDASLDVDASVDVGADADAGTDADGDAGTDAGTDAGADADASDAGELACASDNCCGGSEPLTFEGLDALPGDACEACGVLVCDGDAALRCAEGAGRNVCGFCDGDPRFEGRPCGRCGGGETVCSDDGRVVCAGAPPANACGGCGELFREPGISCADDGVRGVFVCSGPDTVECRTPGANACGGSSALDAAPGEPCGACGLGVVACDGPEATVCNDFGAPNACGGCAPLSGSPGDACGECGRWACEGSERVVCELEANPCGGCDVLEGGSGAGPGEACDEGTWACATPNQLVCDPDARNACGGSADLAGAPGESCGVCADGIWQCASPDLLACVGGTALNACDACGVLSGEPDTYCGPGFVWTCADGGVECAPDGSRNACGGTVPLDGTPGDSCGSCGSGVVVCSGADATVCEGADDCPPPEVRTLDANAVDATTATLNGELIALGVPPASDHGFCYGTSRSPTFGRGTCVRLGAPGVGTFAEPLSALEPGRTYYVRAFAEAAERATFGEERTFDTRTSAPGEVAASDGTRDDAVEITWSPVAGAVGYVVERDGALLVATGATTTDYIDRTAPAGGRAVVTNVAATQGTRFDGVEVTWSTSDAFPGERASYAVRASFPVGQSEPSLPDEGWRAGEQPTGFDVQISGGGWRPVGDVRAYLDTTAPSGVIDAGVATASDGAFPERVALELLGATLTPPSGRSYEVRPVFGVSTGAASGPEEGARGVGELAIQWQRSEEDRNGDFSDLEGATDVSVDDLDAPADGAARWYRAVLSAAGTESATSLADRGFRGSGPRIETLPILVDGPGLVRSGVNVVRVGSPAPTAHGLCWGPSLTPAPGDGTSTCTDRGPVAAAGAVEISLSGIVAGASGFARAYATGAEGTVFGSALEWSTATAAPQDVRATDGTRSEAVGVSWSAVPNAVRYLVYRDGVALGDVATASFDDASADAGGTPLAGGMNVAATRDRGDRVTLSWDVPSGTPGASYTYQVSAINAADQESGRSAPDGGFRAASPVTGYELERDGGAWIDLGDVRTYDDLDAPAGTFAPGSARASDGTSGTFVTLLLDDASAGPGAAVRYRLRARNAAGTGSATFVVEGWRDAGELSVLWERSAGDADADYSALVDVTGSSARDDAPPSDGSARFYRALVSASDGQSARSSADRGFVDTARPSVRTDAASAITSTGAVLNGTLTNVGTPAASAHGFCYGPDAAPALGESTCVDLGAPAGAGAFDRFVDGFAPGERVQVRAYATNASGTAYGENVAFTTVPEAPGDVDASDGQSPFHVDVSWSAVDGATSYEVLRDGVPIGVTAATTWRDTGAGEGGVPSSEGFGLSATDGTVSDRVTIRWSAPTVSDGQEHAYRVVARGDAGNSAASSPNNGFRSGFDVSGYEVEVGGLWINAGDTTSYDDFLAAAGTVEVGDAVASDGTSSASVALSLSSFETAAGAPSSYRVRARNQAGTGAASPSVQGRRAAPVTTAVWERSAGDSPANFAELVGVGVPGEDASAPANGEGRYYRVRVSSSQGTVRSGADRGFRSADPEVQTDTPSAAITAATWNGTLVEAGAPAATDLGFCWAASADDATPTRGEADVTCASVALTTGAFSLDVTGLSSSTEYAVSAWAENAAGTAYGAVVFVSTQNECGGAATLVATPGASCGTCGFDAYVCDGSESVVCDGDTVLERFADEDGDTWGRGDATSGCDVPAGFAERGGDCADDPADPDAAAINPGATDLPDLLGVDANCDGVDGDLSRSVVVSAAGRAGAAGTFADPYERIADAMARANADDAVDTLLVVAGTYAESVTLADGVSLYGAYAADGSRDAANGVTIQSPEAIGMRVAGYGGVGEVAQVTIESADADGVAAWSSRAVVASAVSGSLTIRDATLRSGAGADGAAGAAGVVGAIGGDGGDGADGCADDACGGEGGTFGVPACVSANGAQGGAGGAAGYSGDSGAPGEVGGDGDGDYGGGLGSAGSLDQARFTCQHDYTQAGSGSPGDPGAPADDPTSVGAASGGLVALDWRAGDGEAGSVGEVGGGGGGGGGAAGSEQIGLCNPDTGGGGGGGGAGGCGGGGGGAGLGAGASIGVVALDSDGLVLRDNSIETAKGGSGGDGGDAAPGGAGGVGGDPGEGGEVAPDGGRGGDGGAGGAGSPGTGGGGGHSFGIWRENSYGLTNEGNSFALGAAGAGGLGGQRTDTTRVASGESGSAQEVFTFEDLPESSLVISGSSGGTLRVVVILDDAGAPAATEVGFCWALSAAQTLTTDDCTSRDDPIVGVGYALQATGLLTNTTYFARPFALTAGGRTFGDVSSQEVTP